MRTKGVALTGEVYAVPLHRQPVFASSVKSGTDFPAANDVCARHVCLPIHSDMTDDEADTVIRVLKSELGAR